MIILTPKNHQIHLHQIPYDDTEFINGFFKVKDNNPIIKIDNIEFNYYNKRLVLNEDYLVNLLKNDKILLRREDSLLVQYLNQENITFEISEICDNCLNYDIVKQINSKIYTLSDIKLCRLCAEKYLSDIAQINYYIAFNELELLLNKYTDLNEIIKIFENKFDPINNEELTLYDSFEVTEENYEKIYIDKLDIPDKFKNILSKKVNHLLPVQSLALKEGLLDDVNLLIVSATASGKTLIGEIAGIPKAMENKKMIYLSPLVALANQKYRDFKHDYEELGLNIVIKVGYNRVKDEDELEIIEKPIDNADIIVATYEGLDFILRSGEYEKLKEVGVVIIDEIHMLENEERGHRLNGLVNRLLTLFREAQIIGLSATIKNSKEIANEFEMKLVEYDKRPVKLERHLIPVEMKEKENIIVKLCKKEFNNISSKGYHGQTIIFTDSRRKTQLISNYLNNSGVDAQFYHAGLSYSRKLEIEEDFLSQQISTVVTTAALASGVDFPASMVIFDSLRMGIEWLSNNEFHQMLGRAGRPSYHDVGKVYLLPLIDGYDNELEVAENLLSNDVDDVNVLYDTLDVYEQVLSDISAIEHVNIDSLKSKYDNMLLPITFNEALSELENNRMIVYDNDSHTFNITQYGRAVSKSFINIEVAEHIKINLYSNLIELIIDIELLKNAYISNRLINNLSRNLKNKVPTTLFSDKIKHIIFTGKLIENMDTKLKNKLFNLYKDFMICNCNNHPYCDCFERNISQFIIQKRLGGWSPKKISKELMKRYDVLIYQGDIYSYLDQCINVLEAIKRISKTSDIKSTSNECISLIKKIEGE